MVRIEKFNMKITSVKKGIRML